MGMRRSKPKQTNVCEHNFQKLGNFDTNLMFFVVFFTPRETLLVTANKVADIWCWKL